MKKKIVLLSILILLLITGCYSKEDGENVKKYKKQGEINAINYVKEKYGFKASVKSVEEVYNCNALFGCATKVPTGDVNVKLNYNKKDFYVYITGENSSLDGIDDYQMNEIKEDLFDFFKQNISIDLYDYNIDFNVEGIKPYYNKSNLKEMLEYIKKIEIYCIGYDDLENLNLFKVHEFIQNMVSPVELINFDSKEKCQSYKKAEIKNVQLVEEEFKDIYKSSMIKFEDSIKKYYQYDNISNYNHEVYVYPSSSNVNYPISLAKIDGLEPFKKLYPELNDKKIEQVSNAYSISKTNSLIHIYYLKEKINISDNDKVFGASFCYSNGEKQYHIEDYYGGTLKSSLDIGSVGEYYVIPYQDFSYCDSDVTFALLKISDY